MINFNFLKYRKIYYFLSTILFAGSIVSLVVFGLKAGIDLTGGSILEIEFEAERPANSITREKLSGLDLGEFSVQPAGEKGMILRMKELSEEEHQKVLEQLKEYQIKELRFESIGPTISSELRRKTKSVIILATLAIALYITVAFGKVARPINSWQLGVISLFSLLHDILIPLGILAIFGHFYGAQFTIPVIVALLTILGYSINNTVVTFDRIRENASRKDLADFDQVINDSLNQTLGRQLGTSLTTLFPLIFIFFLGGETLKYFSLVLIFGIICGVYSSLFLVAPILFDWIKRKKII